MTRVVAAVMRRRGEVFICQRRSDQDHPGKWEFPGGKMEADETPVQTLKRELHEELFVDAVIGEKITRYEYSYPGKKPIELLFFRVDEFFGEPETSQFAAAAWVRPEELPAFDFLEGDLDFVKWLAAEGSDA